MSSPTEHVHPEMAGVDPREECLLPPHWGVDDLDISVSLELDERLGNCVYSGFWVDYGAANLAHAVRMIKAHPHEPLIYFGHLPPQYEELDEECFYEISWPLRRRGSLDVVLMRQTYESYEFPHTGMTPVLVLRNRYLGGERFRHELMICGDGDDLVENWTYTARKIRRMLRCPDTAETGGDA